MRRIAFSDCNRLAFGLFSIAMVMSVGAQTSETRGSDGTANVFYSGLQPVMYEVLSVGQSRTSTIRANKQFNWTNIGVFPGQKYKFTVGSLEWNNGVRETTAAGYSDNFSIPGIGERRFTTYKWMALVGALYGDNETESTYLADTAFLIGSGRSSWTVIKSGWIAAFANDCYSCYADNSRVVTLTIKRIE